MTQLELPFDDRGNWMPLRWRSMAHLHRECEKWRKSPTPHNHVLIGGLRGGRYLIATTRFPPSQAVYVVGFYDSSMQWNPIAELPVFEVAKWVADQWVALPRTALLKALWIWRHRPAVDPLWIATEAQAWDNLTIPAQWAVWKLIQAGAPGRVVEVIVAGKACEMW